MRIALFGGSFNPIHIGHITIAKSILSADLADEVWLMVSPQNPLKPQTGLLPEQIRLKCAQKAVENIKSIVVSDYEFRLPRPSYTYYTLQCLRNEYLEHKFTLCIGADNWERFSQWRNTDDITAHHDIIVYPRLDNKIDRKSLPDYVKLLQCPLVNISSTIIRQRLASGLNIRDMVPPCVESLIETEWKKLQQ